MVEEERAKAGNGRDEPHIIGAPSVHESEGGGAARGIRRGGGGANVIGPPVLPSLAKDEVEGNVGTSWEGNAISGDEDTAWAKKV